MTICTNIHSSFISEHVSSTGPASYSSAARPTITCSNLTGVERVRSIIITGGYAADVVSISGNIVTYRVRNPTVAHTHTFTGSALATHQHAVTGVTFTGGAMGAHQHDITTVAAAGGGQALTEPAATGPFESAGGGATNANAVDGSSAGTPTGTVGGNADAITAGTPAGTNGNNTAAVASEVADATNLSTQTITIVAEGF